MRYTIVLAVLLAGCASPVWVKEGSTQQEFQTAQYECERDQRQSGYYGPGLIGAYTAREFFRRCMMAKGFMNIAN